MKVHNPFIGSVRLVDKKTRVVELAGPEPLGSRQPTDQKLMLQVYGLDPPRSVGLCIAAGDRTARFLIDASPVGDQLPGLLDKHPIRLARPYATNAWVVGE